MFYRREAALMLCVAAPQLCKPELFSPLTAMKAWSPEVFHSEMVQQASSWAAANQRELPQSLCQPCCIPVKLS